MDLTYLRVSIDELLGDEVELNVAGLANRLNRLVWQENWDKIAEIFDDKTAKAWRKEVELHGKDKLTGSLAQLAKLATEKLNREIKQALKNATSFQLRGSLGELRSWHSRC